jgi:hypothetical protein
MEGKQGKFLEILNESLHRVNNQVNKELADTIRDRAKSPKYNLYRKEHPEEFEQEVQIWHSKFTPQDHSAMIDLSPTATSPASLELTPVQKAAKAELERRKAAKR